mgnify:CR=1 FL=1
MQVSAGAIHTCGVRSDGTVACWGHLASLLLTCDQPEPPSPTPSPTPTASPTPTRADQATASPSPTATATASPSRTPTGAPSCPETNLGSALPVTASGSTAGRANALGGASCGGTNAPDYAYQWTAPSAGTYTIDTFGSSFDTVLYVRDASCGGDELACNDDAGGTYQSQVTVTLAAAQTIVIVVDGYDTASGSYSLHISGGATPTPTPTATATPTPTPTATLLAAPVLSSPSNEATGVSTTPTFSWSAVSGANRYWLMVATSRRAFPTDPNARSCPDCISAGYTNTTSQTFGARYPNGVSNGPNPPPPLNTGTTYYWKVQAFNNTTSPITQGHYSTTFSFTTILPPPVLYAPSNEATRVSTTPTFSWSAVSGANRYRLMVATSRGALPTDPAATTCPSCVISCSTSSTTHTAGVGSGRTCRTKNSSRARHTTGGYKPTLFLHRGRYARETTPISGRSQWLANPAPSRPGQGWWLRTTAESSLPARALCSVEMRFLAPPSI